MSLRDQVICVLAEYGYQVRWRKSKMLLRKKLLSVWCRDKVIIICSFVDPSCLCGIVGDETLPRCRWDSPLL